MSHRDWLADNAPPAPPCFSTRMQWVEYLRSAAAAQKQDRGEPGPLVFEAGKLVRFNYAFPFCADCSAQHSLAMSRVGKCRPDYLNTLPGAQAGASAADPAAPAAVQDSS